MAQNTSLVLLGYDDEQITEKQKSFVDFTTNKIGGKPIWPNGEISVPACPLCGLNRPLILQIYAPLEKTQFHRTFYIFACMNPVCSNESKGWICMRTQLIEKVVEKDSGSVKKRPTKASNNINWCSGADDWDDEFADDECYDKNYSSQVRMEQQELFNDNVNEQNGNVVSHHFLYGKNDNRNMSDEEEEESNSMDSDPIPMFNNLQVIDDKNANCGAQGGAIGILNVPNAYAEIEGEESELVTIDAPVTPERDLIAMLKQTTAVPSDIEHLALKSYYIAVDEERRHFLGKNEIMDDHIRELMQEYQAKEEKMGLSPSGPGNVAAGGVIPMDGDGAEKYEKTAPVHGDVMFHMYLERIQENPGQILRYSRDSLPLLIARLTEPIPKCQYCGNELLCELQILSTLISKLSFVNGDPVPIEFGNVLIFTCTKNCWDTPDKMRLEHIIVQKEP